MRRTALILALVGAVVGCVSRSPEGGGPKRLYTKTFKVYSEIDGKPIPNPWAAVTPYPTPFVAGRSPSPIIRGGTNGTVIISFPTNSLVTLGAEGYEDAPLIGDWLIPVNEGGVIEGGLLPDTGKGRCSFPVSPLHP